MTNVAVGCIFHWDNYTFSDGEKANKYFVILSAKKGSNYLAVIATSKSRKKKFVPGCHHVEGYYHIQGGRRDYFPEDTWLLLAESVELQPAEFLKLALAKTIELCGNLRLDVANAVRNCFKLCPDASGTHIALL